MPQSSNPETSKEVLERYSSVSEEAERSEPPAHEDLATEPSQLNGDVSNGFKFLHSMMTATLFSDYFVHHANISMMHQTRAERVNALCDKHPKFYKWCRNLDLITRGVLWILLVAATAFTAWGVVFRLLFFNK